MTSIHKINSNHANARASTGPKTAQGRARSSRNALRHGLSLPVTSDPVWSEEAEAFAREIAGRDASAELQDLARQIAEAQIDLRRVHCARDQVLWQALRDPNYESRASIREKVRVICHFLPRNPPGISMADLEAYLTSTPQGSQKLATILSERAKKLAAIDRYERRARSRRKFAIRAFDAAHSTSV